MNLTFDSDFVRLDASDHQVIGDGGPGADYDNGTLSLRCDNKVRGIMVKIPEPWKFHEDGDQYNHQVYVDVYIDEADLAKVNDVRVRLVLDTPWSVDDASVGNWAEWSVLEQLSGGWNRVMIDPSKPYSSNGAGGVGKDPRWRWAGVVFDVGNVPGKEPNVKITKVDVGSTIVVSNDNIVESFDWDQLSQLDPFGVIKKVSPQEFMVMGSIEFQNIKLESYDEFVTLYRDMKVGAGCSFRIETGKTYGTHGKVDFSEVQFALLDRTGFESVMGTPFDGFSIKFGPTTTLAACTIHKCGLVVQNGAEFNGVEVTEPFAQWNTFDLITATQKVRGDVLDGTVIMSMPEGEFRPFCTFDDNNGDEYFFGAPALFEQIYFEGDYFGGTSDHEWFYWAETNGWTPLEVTGPSVRNLRGYVNFNLQPDWQKLDGLYQIKVVIDGLYAIMPDPAHKYAFYVPVKAQGVI